MAEIWLEHLKKAQKTCLLQDGKKKVHYTFADGAQLVEEYDSRNGNLLVRKWCKKTRLGGQGQWEYEVGEQFQPPKLDAMGMMESSSNPICARKDSKQNIQWRIRNLSYPLDVYDVSMNKDEQVIIVRTSNKKYYKKIKVPDLERASANLEDGKLSFAHANNTLIITYKKPEALLVLEKTIESELDKVKIVDEGDVSDCKQS